MGTDNGQSNLGKIGEDLAEIYLRNKGWRILGRNIRQKFGEIDILAKDPQGILVFVEVKTLRVFPDGLIPEDNLTSVKLNKMHRMAESYANAHPELIHRHGFRVDLLAIAVPPEGEPEIRHYENLS